ncbi:unnamed protein product [Rotaria sordida]|uniref:Uncharacterized protein n=1 Tax=Rotaria sordida TaxID=392033 RepID=A0A820C552_9BILA|nr:unnamed protein product [Rotaria sordida]
MVDVLYSLVDVNQRFDRLVVDPLTIRNLNMTSRTIKSMYDQTFSIDDEVLSKICEKILCRIDHQVNRLTVEQYSIKRILVAANYPQLYSLSLINFEGKILSEYLTGDSILCELVSKQITHLNIDIKDANEELSTTTSNIFILILSLCKKLFHLNFGDLFFERKHWNRFSCLPVTSYPSSTLTKLQINLSTFTECLFLLDTHLECLSTLIIHVNVIYYPIQDVDNTKKLPKLKHLSFIARTDTYYHDIHTLVFPLIRRMINLEELKLYLLIKIFDSNFIDGTQLYDQLLFHMTKLNEFTFSIQTLVYRCKTNISLSSNEDIQRSFDGREYQQVGSYVDINSDIIEAKCHIYSLPYVFEYLPEINNSFPGGMFHTVRYLIMIDGHSFEHKFFQLISHDLPFLEMLDVHNSKPQKDKQYSSTTLITFSYLKLLNLKSAHVDYAEQFLFTKITHLPRLLNLCISYESLTMITKNFTINTKCLNFNKLKDLDLDGSFPRPENFHQYFPLL